MLAFMILASSYHFVLVPVNIQMDTLLRQVNACTALCTFFDKYRKQLRVDSTGKEDNGSK